MVSTQRLSQPLRSLRFQSRAHLRNQTRFASSTPGGGTEAAQKKAQDALATAQKYAAEAAEKGKQVLGPVGERLGNLLGGMSRILHSRFR